MDKRAPGTPVAALLARPTGPAQLPSEDAEDGWMQNTPDSMELVLEHSPMRTPRTPSAAGSSCVSELWSSPDSNILASSSSGRDPGKANADASASQHSQALIGGPSLQAQEPKRRRSTAACKMLCRAHWRCIGCFQTRAFCRDLTFLLLGVLVSPLCQAGTCPAFQRQGLQGQCKTECHWHPTV